MTLFYQKNWMKLWSSDGYQTNKQAGFNALDAYLQTPPRRILDIGCGLAWESREFYKKYNTELWLLDGDVSSNENKNPEKSNHGKWHDSPDTLLFYHSLGFLDQQLKEASVSNYHLVDVNNIDIPEDVKFDVITSWLSCGFHYPVSTYKDLISKHSHENTVIAMDLRLNKHTKMPTIESGLELVNAIRYGKKHVNSHIRFV
jgi:SAM-dependent methyltransferase